MSIKLARILSAALVSLIFVLSVLHQPETVKINSTGKASAIKVAVKITHRTEYVGNNSQTEAAMIESTIENRIGKEENKETLTEQDKGEIFIDSYLDMDSADENYLIPPVLDLTGIYSKIIYPVSRRRKNIEASFNVRIFVSADGNVYISIPQNTDIAFADSVARAFKNAKATPALYKNKPADVTFTIPINFVLN